MSEEVFAFSIPIGPAFPGLDDGQLAKRRQAARREALTLMPSITTLMGSHLEERVAAEGPHLKLCFYLVESGQIPLPFSARRKDQLTAAVQLCKDLSKLKRDAEEHVIRVGEMSLIASKLSAMDEDGFQNFVHGMSEKDVEYWRLAVSRRGKVLSVDFDDRHLTQQMPLLPAFRPEHGTRQISCLIREVARTSAIVEVLRETPEQENGKEFYNRCKRVIRLYAPEGSNKRDRLGWFLLFVAKYKGLQVDLRVKVAVDSVDHQPVFLEFCELINGKHLKAHEASVMMSYEIAGGTS